MRLQNGRAICLLYTSHTIRLESHALGIDVNLGALREYVTLVEGINHVQALGKDTMLLQHHYIIILQLLQGLLSKFQTAWQLDVYKRQIWE